MGGRGRRRRRFGRPTKDRVLAAEPLFRGFGPTIPRLGTPPTSPRAGSSQITMTADEYEAYRLTEYEGLSQEDAASKMGISRGTLWRILQSAKGKLARMIVEGHALQIAGGNYIIGGPGANTVSCPSCGHVWTTMPRHPSVCPKCGFSPSKR